MTTETRYGPAPTLVTRDDGTEVIRGISPVYFDPSDSGTEFRLWTDTVERVRPGAAGGALEPGADVRSFFNHNPDIVLGRTKSGTLTLKDTKHGVEFEATPPDTQGARDALTSIRRGDVDGSSFMFQVVRESWEFEKRAKGEPELAIRWLEEIRMVEVGPVSIPAYDAATSGVSARHIEAARAGYEQAKRQARDEGGPDFESHLEQLSRYKYRIKYLKTWSE